MAEIGSCFLQVKVTENELVIAFLADLYYNYLYIH